MSGMVKRSLAVRELLESLGYDLSDQHFRKTPERVAAYLNEFRKNGNPDTVANLLNVKFDEGDYEELVMVGPVRYISMCAHHMLPVTGSAWVGYLPDKHVCGLSKLERLVDHFARQLTVQERVTAQIADALQEHLKPRGCMVVIRAAHGCMTVRGVLDPGALTKTSAVRGLHKDSEAARMEFLTLMEMK